MAGAAQTDAKPKMPRKQREIISTATHLFRRYGFRRVTVEEICREAGASKATFYKYFANKVELVKRILRRIAEASHRKTDEIQALDEPFHERVRRLVDFQLEHTRKTSDEFIEDFYRAADELAEFVEELTAGNQARMLAFIKDAQERGDARPEVRPEFVLAMLGKLNELAADEELRRHYPDYAELTREIVDFFFYGLMKSE